ncbi:MAG TPA: glycoside hydrolase family 9 protein, partial [Ignavibacteriales bacterium]|nr:glycoside hydrolase family 9 protein [Ignavibacteriales bacterium]
MKKTLIIALMLSCNIFAQSWIRVNQIGYKKYSIKTAVLVSKDAAEITEFALKDALTDEVKYASKDVKNAGKYEPFNSTYRLSFTKFEKDGNYYIEAGGVKSPAFRIADDVYDGTADFLLKYMRQQRCGYNPYLKDSCHTHDGFIIYHPELDSTFIDVVGGWHDASDYLQYTTTSANAVFQLLFAYSQNPKAFGDRYNAKGLEGANGIPDILDEAKWGLDWLNKMNPKKDFMFNQIADDRDHAGFKLPTQDVISYGKGLERPVYFITGKPQGVFQNKNRTTGVASTAGKFASAFMLGAELLKDYYPEFAAEIQTKSIDAYNFGLKYPGACQTAPCKSPYFYEEDNWTDDMELAATQLYNRTGDAKYLHEAADFGKQEIFTPWMGADTANHYQWYPFLNLGHYYLAQSKGGKISKEFTENLRIGLERIYRKGKDNAFMIGIPFIWCSNNLVAAALTQSSLYYKLTGDDQYLEMEASLRDWLFGCNPWGTSMIVGLPGNGDTPVDPHTAFTALHGFPVDGGLVDGPVYNTIFGKLKGLTLYHGDEYAEFQSAKHVYHDDYGDYSTNEPTMDGTASLTYYLSSLANGQENDKTKKEFGGIIRGDTTAKVIYLAFTGHEFADGGEAIAKVLTDKGIKGNFFLTGDFYRNPANKELISKLVKNGNYLGAHSDNHLLYAPWEKRDSVLIGRDEFKKDIQDNYSEMQKFGIKKENAKFFLPAYEWYNQKISDWINELGLQLVNFTPGTASNADYTIPSMQNYKGSDEIYARILKYEETKGLNGFIL